ncbi:unnamed protein product [Mytilus coruscus]|uniref:Uncharacterized protein n=1 Tax=Mytilus coruscus TaxID=42192 RepID=A0A6J8CL41_MYTCO|nr:unnamed protein product [Mytilus coruscus]
MASFDNDFISISALEEKVQEQNEETLNLPTGLWYKINDVNEVDVKFGKSSILTLKTREGGIFKVWVCSGLNREMSPLEDDFKNKVTNVVEAIIYTIVSLQNRFNTKYVKDMINMVIELEIGDWLFSDDYKVLYNIVKTVVDTLNQDEDSDDDSEFEGLDSDDYCQFEGLDSDSEFDSGFYSESDDEDED